MPRDAQDEAESGRAPFFQREHRVRGQAGEERARTRAPKTAFGQAASRLNRQQSEPGEIPRMAREPRRTEQIRVQSVPVCKQRRHQLQIRISVGAEG